MHVIGETRAFHAGWILVGEVAGARYSGPMHISKLATKEKSPSRR